MKLARTEKWFIAAMVITGALCTVAVAGLRYEQRVEGERYQLGYSQGLQIGELRQRDEFKRNFNCYRLTESDESESIVICGVLEITGQDGNPIVPSVADPTDLEQ